MIIIINNYGTIYRALTLVKHDNSKRATHTTHTTHTHLHTLTHTRTRSRVSTSMYRKQGGGGGGGRGRVKANCWKRWVFKFPLKMSNVRRGDGCSRRQRRRKRRRESRRWTVWCVAEFRKLECRRRNGESGKGCRADGSRTSRLEQSCGCTYSKR